MDYSVLLGVHSVDDADPFHRNLEPGWNDAGFLVSEERNGTERLFRCFDCRELYYVGIIDHSIKYGIKKQAENLLHMAKGTSDRASCVSADTYAERQLMFLYQKVMGTPAAMDIGTEGRLRVDILEAEELVGADWSRDCRVRECHTWEVKRRAAVAAQNEATVPINCNPVWNCSLYLPVHQVHQNQDVKISVWDEDHVKSLRGNDDFLGRLSVPMSWVLKGPVDLPKAELLDTPRGRISVRCFFEAAEDLLDDTLLTKDPRQALYPLRKKNSFGVTNSSTERSSDQYVKATQWPTALKRSNCEWPEEIAGRCQQNCFARRIVIPA
eukprot:g10791.t1